MRVPSADLRSAEILMADFARRTCIDGASEGPRYLWTDAYAVAVFFSLSRHTGNAAHFESALRLVDRVHHVLGKHRADSAARAWLSGLDDAAAELHPTCGGLRIGKKLPERTPHEPFDERLEWDRDGQYFHYLTKWMQALDLAARETGQSHFLAWAIELAASAHRAFVYGPAGRRRMFWKMSIDLTRPLVESMGQHDALDGYLTCLELERTAARSNASQPQLAIAASDFAAMVDRRQLATADPLGLGGLLCDVVRASCLLVEARLADATLLEALVAAARAGLSAYAAQPDLDRPASQRLAFRELGLATGLRAVAMLSQQAPAALATLSRSAVRDLDALQVYVSLADTILAFWSLPAHRRDPLWREHRDVNDVMLAAALVPDSVVRLDPPAAGARN